MKPKALALAVVVLVGLAAAPLLAQMPDMPLGKWWKQPRVVEALQLTADQQEKLETVFSKNRKSFVDLRADVDRRSIDLDELLAKKDSDPKKVAAASDALEQAKARLGKARTMMVFEMKTVLTEEQWRKIETRREEWRRQLANERGRQFRDGRGMPKGAGRPMGPGPQPQAPGPDAPDAPRE